MKVAFPSYDVQTLNGRAGGVGAFITHFARLLTEQGDEVAIIKTRGETHGFPVDQRWRDNYRAWGIDLIEVHNTAPSSRRWRTIRELFGRGEGSLLEIAATALLVPTHRQWIPLASWPRWGRLLRHRGLARLTWLSPENTDTEGMIELSRRLIRRGFPYLNLFFHSPSFAVGLTPFVKTTSDQERFYDRIRSYLEFIRESRISSIKLSEALDD